MRTDESRSALTTDQESRIAAGIAEYRAAEGKVSIEEFVAAYPDIAEPLEACLKALVMLGVARPDFSENGDQSDSSDPNADAIPGVIGDFRVVRQIGRGGMGMVYEASQISLGRKVALKVLPFAGMLDQRSLQRFRNEVTAAAQLDHPNIVDVYGVGCDRGIHHYAMRLIDGPTLADVLNELRRRRDSSEPYPDSTTIGTIMPDRGRPPSGAEPTRDHTGPSDHRSKPQSQADLQRRLETARAESTRRLNTVRQPKSHFRSLAALAATVAEALDHAHQQGVVHRDVKPANLMLDASCKPWVTDFGLAQVESSLTCTMTGEIVGTAPYMSPEQILGKRVLIDHRTDIYSLGVTLYELSTLLLPFETVDRSELNSQICFQEPVAPRQLNPAVPADLETIILKSMEKDPAARYQTSGELADDLRRFVSNEPIKARRPTTLSRLTKWSRRNTQIVVPAVLAILLVLLVSAGLLGWAWRDHSARREQIVVAVHAALQEAERLQSEEKWSAALNAAKRGQDLLSTEIRSGLLHEEVTRRVADLELVTQIAQARELAGYTDVANNRFDDSVVSRAYKRAFEHWGVTFTNDEYVKAASRIRSLSAPLRREVTAGLYHWWFLTGGTRNEIRSPLKSRLCNLLEKIDDDAWRSRLVAAIQERNRGELSRMATEESLYAQPSFALYLLAKALEGVYDREGFLSVLRRAALVHPDSWLLNREFSLALVNVKEPSGLQDRVRFNAIAAALRPRSEGCLLNYAIALRDAERPEESSVILERLAQLAPAYSAARVALATSLRGSDPERATNLLSGVVGQEGSSPRAQFEYASALFLSGRFEEAASEYEKLTQDADIDIRLQARTNVAMSLWNAGKDQERALTMLRELVDRLPDDVSYGTKRHFFDNACLALNEAGHHEEAQLIAERRLATDPNSLTPLEHFERGMAFHFQGQHEEAAGEFGEIVDATDPVMRMLGRTATAVNLVDAGERRLGIAMLRDFVDQSPNGVSEALMSHSRMLLAWALTEDGDWDNAKPIAETLVPLVSETNSGPTLFLAGWALSDNGQDERAVEALLKALSSAFGTPKSEDAMRPRIHLLIARSYARLGKTSDAVVSYRAALRGLEQNTEASTWSFVYIRELRLEIEKLLRNDSDAPMPQ